MIRVGTAGWTLPTGWQDRFPEGETHLDSYGRVFRAVEINRTFRNTPRPSTFARWADSVPDGFRFSVKTPREVTHDRRLEDVREPLSEFLEAASRLADRLDRATAAGDEAEEAWVIFDNTARGEGTGDALAMAERLG